MCQPPTARCVSTTPLARPPTRPWRCTGNSPAPISVTCAGSRTRWTTWVSRCSAPLERMRRWLLKRDPGSHATGLAGALRALGLLLATTSQPAAAECLDEAAAIYRKLGEPYDPHLGQVLRELGDVHTLLGRPDAVAAAVEEAAHVHQRLADRDPAYTPVAVE